MIEILRNKNSTTKFQILVEIANGGPEIQQREIAKELNITPQAVSDYVAQLIGENLLVSEGRSSYRVTNEGVNWIIRSLRELHDYNTFVQRAVNNISICAALAEDKVKEGQKVGIKMKNGLLFAVSDIGSGASGIATIDAEHGEDVGVYNIKGIVQLEIGNATIIKIPGIERGGSRKVDYAALKRHVTGGFPVVSLGLEAYVALRSIGADFWQYGATEVAIESARSGLNPLVVCTDSEVSVLIARLEKEKIRYKLIDTEKMR
ncbi:MAG: MarR family transcriptional regulator [Dehalococcoidia bacterium]|nr:MarR family transcriptional regulator [Dehalococcoidia bacterium]